jgi:hypothetical protein
LAAVVVAELRLTTIGLAWLPPFRESLPTLVGFTLYKLATQFEGTESIGLQRDFSVFESADQKSQLEPLIGAATFEFSSARKPIADSRTGRALRRAHLPDCSRNSRVPTNFLVEIGHCFG